MPGAGSGEAIGAGIDARFDDACAPGAADAGEALQDALRRTTPAVQAVLTRMRELADPPEKVTVSFGIKLTAAAGVVIAQASSEANFEVSVEWTRPMPPGRRTTDATQGDE